jgi:hypothetical protein
MQIVEAQACNAVVVPSPQVMTGVPMSHAPPAPVAMSSSAMPDIVEGEEVHIGPVPIVAQAAVAASAEAALRASAALAAQQAYSSAAGHRRLETATTFVPQKRAKNNVSAEVQRLKHRYCELKGNLPRGRMAGDAGWLAQKIAEMEGGRVMMASQVRTDNRPTLHRSSEAEASVTLSAKPTARLTG